MATAAAKPSALARARLVLANPKTGYMTLFGFGSGLPYALLLGTLTAWLTDAKVDLETMGVISLIGLAYAFKFLWSPLLDRLSLPGLAKLGRRKQWIVTAQFILGIMLLAMAQMDPLNAIGLFSLCAGSARSPPRRRIS